jgi:hypothetical protein
MMTTVSYAQTTERNMQPVMDGDRTCCNHRIVSWQYFNTRLEQSMRVVAENGSQTTHLHTKDSGPLHPELQFARCMSNRYRSESFPRCVSCTRRWAGDTCRFQAIRFFLRDENRNIVGISFVESQKADAPSMNFPSRWNMPLADRHISRVKVCLSCSGEL